MSEELIPLKKAKGKKEEVPVTLHNFAGTKQEKLQQLYDLWYGCERCQLSKFRRTEDGAEVKDIVYAEGNPDAHVMIIGEAPGEEETETGIPFYGSAGKLLNQIIAMTSDDPGIQELYTWYCKVKHTEANTSYFRDKMLEYRKQELFITNSVSCRPPDNRTPTKHELKACWERLMNIIYIVDPLLIVTSGKTSLETVLKRQIEITKVRGHIFDVNIPGHVRDVTYPVIATLHPAHLLRMADWKDKNGNCMKTVRDYLNAFKFVDELRLRYYGTPIPHRINI